MTLDALAARLAAALDAPLPAAEAHLRLAPKPRRFWKAGVMIAAEDVGGARSRTARLWVGDGRCTIASQGQEVPL